MNLDIETEVCAVAKASVVTLSPTHRFASFIMMPGELGPIGWEGRTGRRPAPQMLLIAPIFVWLVGV